MMYASNPIGTLAECIAHAQYEGFDDIHYEARDFSVIKAAKTAQERAEALNATTPATRRPWPDRDFTVYSMYPQTWGSTALGHGGMGGSAVTTAYTVVLECRATAQFLVYFGGRICYEVRRDSENIKVFIEDCKNHCLADKKSSERYR